MGSKEWFAGSKYAVAASECWWSHWGWPKPIHEIYQTAIERLMQIAVPEENLGPLLLAGVLKPGQAKDVELAERDQFLREHVAHACLQAGAAYMTWGCLCFHLDWFELQGFDAAAKRQTWFTVAQHDAVKQSLLDMQKVPTKFKSVPGQYTGTGAASHEPPSDWEMVKQSRPQVWPLGDSYAERRGMVCG